MISVFRLTPDDAPLLSRIGGITLLESHGHSAPAEIMQAYVDNAFSEEACRQELLDEANLFTAVAYNGQPAGYSKIILNRSHPSVPQAPVTKLERLYLLREFYALKLGHRLLAEAITDSSRGGDRGMWLDVWKENHRAIRFYQAQGFQTVAESEFVLTPERSNPIWVMWLEYRK